MERALSRAFGVTSDAIRGTVGWEWLLWRFLSGLGTGQAVNWDRYPSEDASSVLARPN